MKGRNMKKILMYHYVRIPFEDGKKGDSGAWI
jgi:hypothetical protein